MSGLAESSWSMAADYFVGHSGAGVVLYWWFCLLLPGLAMLPWTAKLARRQFDAAYPLAKVLGIVIPGYLVWLLSALHALPFGRTTVLIVVAWLLAVGAALAWKDRKSLRAAAIWRAVLIEEALFLGVLVLWGLLRYLRPDIQDIEKCMDFAFLNASAAAKYMPPVDPWFASEPINYYYFGHYLAAYLSKLGGFAPAVGYNLMFATLPAMTFVLTISIVANAVRVLRRERSDSSGLAINARPLLAPMVAGLVSALMMTLGGNLHTFVYAVLPQAGAVMGWYSGPVNYFWSDPRSYIGYNPPTGDKTITEFPAYSFVLGDLHGHVMNLMLVLALVLVLFLFLCRAGEIGQTPRRGLLRRIVADIPFLLLMAFLLGLFLMTNAWDFPIYAGLAGLVFLARAWAPVADKGGVGASGGVGGGLLTNALKLLAVLGGAIAVAWPLLHRFQTPAKEIAAVMSHSPLWQLAVLYGQQFVLVALFVAVLLAEFLRRRKAGAPGIAQADRFILLCIVVAGMCIAVPEIVYVKDIYDRTYHRANTMFKFTFQAFALLALCGGYVAYRAATFPARRAIQRWIASALAAWLALPLLFSLYAIGTYYVAGRSASPGLDGLAWMKRDHPDDWRIVQYLNSQAPPGNILEAGGESYSYSGRISMATARPTVLGWRYHEKLWRYAVGPNIVWEQNDPITIRIRDVSDIYCSPDAARTRLLLDKYAVRYIVIGQLEREAMPSLNEAKLLAITRLVFQAGDSVVLEVLSAAGQ